MNEAKRDLYNLVVELRGYHWSQTAVGDCLGISQRRVGQIEQELRAQVHPTPWAQLPYLLRERVIAYQHQHASRLEVEPQQP